MDNRQRQRQDVDAEDVDLRDADLSLTEDDPPSSTDLDHRSHPSSGFKYTSTQRATDDRKTQHVSRHAPKAMADSLVPPRQRVPPTADVSATQGPASPVLIDSSISSGAGLRPHDSSVPVRRPWHRPEYNCMDLDGDLIKSLHTKPLTIPQLVHEIRGIYANLGIYPTNIPRWTTHSDILQDRSRRDASRLSLSRWPNRRC